MSAPPPPPTLLDPSIFASLEAKLEEETQIRDAISQLVQRLDRSVATAQGLLSRVHSTPRARCKGILILPSALLSLISRDSASSVTHNKHSSPPQRISCSSLLYNQTLNS